MKSCLAVVLSSLALSLGPNLTPAAAVPSPIQINIDLAAPGTPISPDLFGIFFEDLNYAADGGLYAELIQNRSFEYSATEQTNWGPFTSWNVVKTGDGEGSWGLGDARPVHVRNPHYLLLSVTKPGNGVGIGNAGFDQIPVEAGKAYEASFFAYQTFNGIKWRGDGVDQSAPMPVTLRLEAENGDVLAEGRIEVSGRDWTKYGITLHPNRTEARAKFVLLMHQVGGLAIDMVSLMPHDTFQGHANGLRRDLAQTIADLHPKFMRFPGGCLVHGPGVHAYYDWKKTVGPLETRQAERNSWGYHQTYGLGFFEYFQFCEDIGAKPLPVVSAGVCCQHAGDSPNRGQEGLPMEEMPAYIQDILDLIEWANGPADSPWGSVRAAAGHPASFGLKYLGVGNEDAITPDFKERFTMVSDVLKAKHPEIVVIGTVGPFPDGEDFDRGWSFAREEKLAMVDEHYYRPPEWFWDNLTRYDSYDRTGPKVYVGEYAAHDTNRRNTLRSALAEAAGCIGFERNGDLVHFASYAPLLARRGHTQWHPDLIYFDATDVFPSANYYVQQLFGQNGGDRYQATSITGIAAGAKLVASTVVDSRSGDIILKVVNGDDAPAALTIHLNGLSDSKEFPAQKILLTGPNADAVNEDGKDPVVHPVGSTIRVRSRFDYEAPPNSLTVFRIKRD